MKIKYLSLILSALLLIDGNIGSAMEDINEPQSNMQEASRSKLQIPKNRIPLKYKIKYFKENNGKIKDELKKQYNSGMNRDRIDSLKERYRKRGGYIKLAEEQNCDSERFGEFCNKTDEVNDIPNYNKQENSIVKGKTFLKNKKLYQDKFLDLTSENITPSTSDSDKSGNELPIIYNPNDLKDRDIRKNVIMFRNDDMEEYRQDEEFSKNYILENTDEDENDKEDIVNMKKIDIKNSSRRNGNKISDKYMTNSINYKNTIGLKNRKNLKKSIIRKDDDIYNKYMTNKKSIYDNEEYENHPQFKTIDDIKTKEDLSKGGIFD